MYNFLLSMADSLFLLITMDKFIASMLTLLLELLEMHKGVHNGGRKGVRRNKQCPLAGKKHCERRQQQIPGEQ